MRELRKSLVIAALLLSPAVLVAARQSQDPTPGVRYVDMVRCFDNYERAQQQVGQLRAQLEAKKKEFDAREAAMMEIDGELAVMDRSSPEFAQRLHELETSKMALERDKQFELERVNRQQLQLYVASYEAVQRAAARVGAQNGYGAIMVIPEKLSELPETLQAAVEALQVRGVLWSNPAYDITDQVLKTLNAGS